MHGQDGVEEAVEGLDVEWRLWVARVGWRRRMEGMRVALAVWAAVREEMEEMVMEEEMEEMEEGAEGGAEEDVEAVEEDD
jgi:hypothetical protein